MNRKGISFTLTLVVIGVVLLMTALTVIVLGGGEIGGFLQRGGGAASDASIQSACSNLAQKIDNNYCSWYRNAEAGDCSDVNSRATSVYDQEVSDADCNWYTDGTDRVHQYLRAPEDVVPSSADNRGQKVSALTVGGGPSNGGNEVEPLVRVGGQWYNCIVENEISRICPAG